jgi:hypothetical protein
LIAQVTATLNAPPPKSGAFIGSTGVTEAGDEGERLMREGVRLWQTGRADESLKVLQRARTQAPHSPALLNNLAVVLAALGRHGEAREVLEEAMTTHPAYATAHANLEKLYAHMSSLAYRRALQPADRVPASERTLALMPIIDGATVVVAAAPPQPVTPPPKATAPAQPAPSAPLATPGRTPPPPQLVQANPSPPAPRTPSREPSVAAAPATGVPPTTSTAAPPAAPVVSSPSSAPARPVEARAQTAASSTPKVSSGRPPPVADRLDATRVATDALKRWAEAWSSKDMNGYVNAYAPGFKGSSPSHEAWRRQRASRIEPRDRIEVRLSEIKAVERNGRIEASFRQHYSADRLNVRSRKEVTLQRFDGRWLIVEESGR